MSAISNNNYFYSAWDERVADGTISECRQCGYRTTDNDAMDMNCLEKGHSTHWIILYKTVHHDAVYETQRVKVGTKTVTDKAAEQKQLLLVKNALLVEKQSKYY